jgi:hypothetical protein
VKGDGMGQPIAAVLLAFFLVAILSKLDGWDAWRTAVAGWFPISRAGGAVAILVPAVEASAALLLVLAPRAGLLASAVLPTVFGLGVLALSRKNSGLACGCFASLTKETIGPKLAVRNFLVAAAAFVVLIQGPAVIEPLRPPHLLAVALLAPLGILTLEAARLMRDHPVGPLTSEDPV